MATVSINVVESPLASSAAVSNVGTLFVAGTADSGPVGPTLVRSLNDYIINFGARTGSGILLYDSLEHFFSDGGSQAYVVRVTDSTATSASLTLNDSSAHPTVKVTAATPGVGGNSIFVVITSTAVEIEDSSGDVLETHAISGSNSSLLGASSAYVTFTQATGTGNTTNLPATLASTALSGGTDATDLTDSSHVSALALFGPSLGPGQVSLPGKTSAIAVSGLFSHAAQFNRFAIGDLGDHTTSAAAIAAAAALNIPTSNQKAGVLIEGQIVKAGVNGSTANRTIPGSAAVAAQRAKAGAQAPANPAPAGMNWPIANLVGFTTAKNSGLTTSWSDADALSLRAAGICYFGVEYNVNCLDEFVTQLYGDDLIYGQATAWAETIAFVAQARQVGTQLQFAGIGANSIAALHSGLQAIVQAHYGGGSLYGDTVSDAASIDTSINTAATAEADQLLANVALKLSPYADQISITINVLALTQQVGASS